MIATALAVAAVVIALPAAYWAFKHDINAKVFADVVDKLHAAGTRERLVKLCRAAGHSPVAQLAEEAAKLVLPAAPPPEERLDYRRAPTERSLEERAREALEPSVRAAVGTTYGWTVVSTLALVAAVAAMVLATQNPARIGAGLGGLLALFGLNGQRSVRRGVRLGLERFAKLARREEA